MKQLKIVPLLLFGLVACKSKEPDTVTSTEVRGKTTSDGKFVLGATSAQRFGYAQYDVDAPKTSFVDVAPADWRPLAATEFRLKNYQFGNGGEVYLSVSSGEVLDNINRWLGQFSQEKINQQVLTQLPTINFLGTTAYWVQTDGNFAGGMGKAAAADYALRGVIADVGGSIVTVKMIGPAADVKAQEQNLRDYVGSMKSSD